MIELFILFAARKDGWPHFGHWEWWGGWFPVWVSDPAGGGGGGGF